MKVECQGRGEKFSCLLGGKVFHQSLRLSTLGKKKKGRDERLSVGKGVKKRATEKYGSKKERGEEDLDWGDL